VTERTNPTRPIDALTPAEWGVLYARLVKYAFYKTKSESDAKDLAQSALQRVIDPEWEAWNPETHPDLARYLMSIVNRLVANRRQGKRVHVEIAMSSEAKASRREQNVARKAAKVASDEPTPDVAIDQADRRARALATLRQKLEDGEDRVAFEVLGQVQEGVDDVKEMAVALGRSVAEVKRAYERLLHHGRQVAEQVADSTQEDPDDGDTKGRR
jgi:DNA-directed RNA polymerase specialized sigma24 family protein